MDKLAKPATTFKDVDGVVPPQVVLTSQFLNACTPTTAPTAQLWECARIVWPLKAANGARTPKPVPQLVHPVAQPSNHVMLTADFTVIAVHVLARRDAAGAKPQPLALTPPPRCVFWFTLAHQTKNVVVSMVALSLEECFWLLVSSLFPSVVTSSIAGELEKESRTLNYVNEIRNQS